MASQPNQILADLLMNSGLALHKSLDEVSSLERLVEVTDEVIEWYLSLNDLASRASEGLLNDLNLRRGSRGGTILDYRLVNGGPGADLDQPLVNKYIEKVRGTIDLSMDFLRENHDRLPVESEAFILHENGNLLLGDETMIREMNPKSLPLQILQCLCGRERVKTSDLLLELGCEEKAFYKAVENLNKDFKKRTKYQSNIVTGIQRQGYSINPIYSIKAKK